MKSRTKNGKEKPPSITSISVGGFKSIYKEQEIEIRPLTILAGANSSGKSSIIQPLLLLKQTLESEYDPGPLLLNGPNVKFTSFSQMLSKISSEKTAKDIEFGFTNELGNKIKISYHKNNGNIEIKEMTYVDGDSSREIIISENLRSKDIENLLGDYYSQVAIQPESGIEYKIERYKFILSFLLKRGKNESFYRLIVPGLLDYLWLAYRFAEIIHVPGNRGNPERVYKKTASGPDFPGIFNNYAASVINYWQNYDYKKIEDLSRLLEMIGLTWKIEAKQLNDAELALNVGRLPHSENGGKKDIVNIADVGFGVSQVLPVLVALLSTKPERLIYIEQPELHLHPRAQAKMAKTLAAAAHWGGKIIIETHSPILILGIQTLVAEGKLSPDLVKLHWFQRLPDGSTEITSRDLDKKGAYGDWPQDFGDVEMAAEMRYLDAVEGGGKAN